MDVFLLLGQSNMAGRGRLGEVPPLHDARLHMWRAGQWQPAVEPLHTDKPTIAGVGLGMSFGLELLRAWPQAEIGLVPAAVGGTPLSRWQADGDLYAAALAVARPALVGHTLAGMLWHQGEGDTGDPALAATYGARLAGMIAALRRDLAAPALPVVVGELGEFLAARGDASHWRTINQALRELPTLVPHTACVASAGLADQGDTLHFGAAALREFGQRYAQAYLRLQPAPPA